MKTSILERVSSAASWLGAVASIIAVAVYYVGSQAKLNDVVKYTVQRSVSEEFLKELEQRKKEIAGLEVQTKQFIENTVIQVQELKEQQQKILLLASTQKMDASLQADFLDEVANRVSKVVNNGDIDKRIKLIESVVIQDPEKALQLPFIKRELSQLTKSVDAMNSKLEDFEDSLSDIKVHKAEVSALSNQVALTNNWMIGIFGALGVSVLGLLIGNVFQHRKQQS
ncbi:hypothetical protein NF212_17735 [Parasalinivibrio latis]|uniref:hypothetical protein n=1 Tax=Parasalinivibrio latis TaxID=2952610 RepID=UPI0030E51818